MFQRLHRQTRGFISLGALLISSYGFASGIPGGTLRSAESFSASTYQMVLSPAYTLSPSGAYMSAELRSQPTADLGAGFGFGAGEVGFNFGAFGVWHALPDTGEQPALSFLGGLYFNRVEAANYFVVKVVPTISKGFRTDFGRVTPYAALPMAPSFRLSGAQNNFTMKASLGAELQFQALPGMRFWAEFGAGILKTPHEFALGFAYPFEAFGA